MKRKFNGLLMIRMTGTIFFGSFFADEYMDATGSNRDVWWTPIFRMFA